VTQSLIVNLSAAVFLGVMDLGVLPKPNVQPHLPCSGLQATPPTLWEVKEQRGWGFPLARPVFFWLELCVCVCVCVCVHAGTCVHAHTPLTG
jgi:hypothetical protein